MISNGSRKCLNRIDMELVYANPDMVFPQTIAERLLTTLSAKGKLNDLTMGIFNHRHCKLEQVYLPNAKSLTAKGLGILRQHKISFINVRQMRIAVKHLAECLGEWTLDNLKTLDVTNATPYFDNRSLFISSLNNLKCLDTLNVSNTTFDNIELQMTIEELPHIRRLDVSLTRVTDITVLDKIKERLLYLSMVNICLTDRIVTTLQTLRELRYLYISDDRIDGSFVSNFIPLESSINTLFRKGDLFPHMIVLDVSGHEQLEDNLIEDFVVSHPDLKFLGVVNCQCCHSLKKFHNSAHPLYNPKLAIAGSETDSQIIIALTFYIGRVSFIRKCLYKLSLFTRETLLSQNPRPDLIKMILSTMSLFATECDIQMSGMVCLYNLTRGTLWQNFHPSLMKLVLQSTLNAMDTFPWDLQVQKNALHILYNDGVLRDDVDYDKGRYATLLVRCLNFFEDPSITEMCVFNCSYLSDRIPTSLIRPYMVKLFSIIHRKTWANEADMTLQYTLSALWNLTNGRPNVCDMFIVDGGIKLCLAVLDKFTGVTAMEHRVLGLLDNICDMPHLRHFFDDVTFAERLAKLLESNLINVSYFAACILSKLVCHGAVGTNVFGKLVDRMGVKILTWEFPEAELVQYHSFGPFDQLLVSRYPEAQLLALWAISHSCACNPARYCNILWREMFFVKYLSEIGVNDDPIRNAILTKYNCILEHMRKNIVQFR